MNASTNSHVSAINVDCIVYSEGRCAYSATAIGPSTSHNVCRHCRVCPSSAYITRFVVGVGLFATASGVVVCFAFGCGPGACFQRKSTPEASSEDEVCLSGNDL